MVYPWLSRIFSIPSLFRWSFFPIDEAADDIE